MAENNRTAKHHPEHFINQLDANLRNALRVILSDSVATMILRRALGIHHVAVVEHDDHFRGLAARGETARLFENARPLHPADIREML